MRRALRLMLLQLALWAGVAGAAIEPMSFADPALEARYKALSAELRCLVCQNQSIIDSNAELALDLRRQVYDQLHAGRSDDEIRDYMVARYGDFVLYEPPVRPATWVLWGAPFLLAAIGFVFVARVARRRGVGRDGQLTEEQRQRAEALLAGKDDKR